MGDEWEDDPKLWGGHAIQLTSDTKWVQAAKKWWSNSYQIWNGRITENISFHETFLAFERKLFIRVESLHRRGNSSQ